MPTPADPNVKTTLRLPAELHEEIARAAAAAGISTNAEMLLRLARDPHVDTAALVLAELQRREADVIAAMQRQMAALWRTLDRAGVTLDHVWQAMAQVPPDGAAAALKKEVEFARELVEAMRAHR